MRSIHGSAPWKILRGRLTCGGSQCCRTRVRLFWANLSPLHNLALTICDWFNDALIISLTGYSSLGQSVVVGGWGSWSHCAQSECRQEVGRARLQNLRSSLSDQIPEVSLYCQLETKCLNIWIPGNSSGSKPSTTFSLSPGCRVDLGRAHVLTIFLATACFLWMTGFCV